MEYRRAEAAPLTFNVGANGIKNPGTQKQEGVDKICLSPESNHDSSVAQPVGQSPYQLRRPGTVF
jgi:hypothetical protein